MALRGLKVMLMTEALVHYRISRSLVLRRRALRWILRTDREVRRRVTRLPPERERRRDVRRNLAVPVYFRLARVRGLSAYCACHAEQSLAVTRNISLRGLGWVHDMPLLQGQYFVEFDVARGEPLVLLVEVCWTLQEDEFCLRSGGRILGVCHRR